MTDWTAGYVADIGYTYGYYTELNPARLALPLLNAGLVAPEITHACELGFGNCSIRASPRSLPATTYPSLIMAV